jgi:hypothetical protein
MPKESKLTPEERIARINRQNALYQKEHLRGITLRFDKKKDAGVIARISSKKNMTDYIRKLVETDIKANR